MSDSPTTPDLAPEASLESVLCTEELDRRPSRPPDYEAENRALATLVQALADSPRTILQTLADTILDVLGCESAGVSLLTQDESRFFWPAIAGVWKSHIGGGTPRDFGPCGDVLDRNTPLMMSHVERRYAYFEPVTPQIEECLLVPFYVKVRAVGTIWAVVHDPAGRKFDNEDLRLLESLARFASPAYQAIESLDGMERQAETLRDVNKALIVSSLRQHELAELAELAQTALRASEYRYRLVVDQVRDYAIFSTDVQGRATTWNQGVEKVLGFREREFIGQDVNRVIFTPEDYEAGVPRRELEEAAQTGSAGNDRWMRRKSGERFFAGGVTTAQRDKTGRLLGFTKIMRDYTEQKQSEQALTRAAEEMVQMNRRKDEFLATLAHELRNPLAPISNAVELLQLDGHEPARVRELGGIMERQVRQMVRLTDDLLDVSRISRGVITLKKQRLELRSVIAPAVEAARPAIEDAGHVLSVDETAEKLPLEADAARITQALTNLLNNAAKYTPRGGRIRLSTGRDGDEAVIRIRDNGVGIPEARLADIFDMFSQVDTSLESRQGGLGIGLTLVKRLVELHGGRVTAQSDGLGTGSEFIVRLPLAAGETTSRPAVSPPHIERPANGQYRVLVVEDSKPVADVFAMMLRALKHEVEVATSGEKALQRIGEFPPDVVFSDISMPGMSGYQFAEQVRRQPEWSDVVLVATTGYGQPEDRQRALRAGFDQHLVKPATMHDLRNLFASLAAKEQAVS